MPFYKVKELDQTGGRGVGTDSAVTSAGVPGEFMKFGVVHKPEGKGSKLHEHPNEEQFTVIISGEMHFVLGGRGPGRRAGNAGAHPAQCPPSLARR